MSEVTRPIPAPRRSKQKLETDETDNQRGTKYENVTLVSVKDDKPPQKAEVYENVQLLINKKNKETANKEEEDKKKVYDVILEKVESLNIDVPKPAPRKKLSGVKGDSLDEELPTEKTVINNVIKDEEVPEVVPKSTGAIRKAPTIPATSSPMTADVASTSQYKRLSSSQSYDLSNAGKRERSNSIHSSNSGASMDSSTLYKTSSPKDLLKSIGATSKLLSESLTERARHKIDKNYRKSKEKVESWTLEKRKTAQKKLKKLTPNNMMKNNKKNEGDTSAENRMSVPVNESVFRDLSFTSPLTNKANNIEDLSRLSMYEVPKLNKRVQEPLPTYDEVVKDGKDENWDRLDFKRNDLTTKSLSKLNVKKANVETLSSGQLTRIKSESNMLDAIESASSSSRNGSNSSIDSIPCPNYPAPVLPPDGVYGKIKKLPRRISDDSDDDDDQVVLLRDKSFACEGTVRATYDVNESISIPSSNISKWSYIDQSALDNDSSSPEPVYANDSSLDRQGPSAGLLYEKISEMQTTLLHPVSVSDRIATTKDDMNNILDASFDVVQEFDPLLNAATKNGTVGLNIIENLMSGDNYTNVQITNNKDSSDGDSIQSENLPTPPERFDSLPQSETTEPEKVKPPPLPISLLRKKKKESVERKPTVIIHQNLALQSSSMENLCDEPEVAQYLAKVDEPVVEGDVDLRRPNKKSTVWHDLGDDPSIFEKSTSIDPVNVAATKTDKVHKSMIPIIPPAPSTNNNNNATPEEILPTYDEAMALGLAPSPSTSSISFKNRFVNLLGNIKRRPSMKQNKPEVRTILEMVPKPPLNDKYISHRGHLLKLPSGALEDLMKELSQRYFEIRDQKLVTFQDQHMTQIKETFPLKFITSIQTVISNKFNSDSGVELHCFEINIAIPKTPNTSMSNANMILTSNNNGNIKTQKSSYIYGLHQKPQRNSVMKKILESFIDKFPENYTSEFTRCGWCYMKVRSLFLFKDHLLILVFSRNQFRRIGVAVGFFFVAVDYCFTTSRTK